MTPIRTAASPLPQAQRHATVESPKVQPPASQPQAWEGSSAASGTKSSKSAEPSYHPQLYHGSDGQLALQDATSPTAGSPGADSSSATNGENETAASSDVVFETKPASDKDYTDIETIGVLVNDIEATMADYQKTSAELQQLIAGNSVYMTEDQLQAAIQQYTDNSDLEKLHDQLAQHGAEVLEAIGQVFENTGALGPMAEPLDNPDVEAAIKAAIEKDPSLLEGSNGKATIDALKAAGWSKSATDALADAYLKGKVNAAYANYDPADPASAANAKAELDALKNSDTIKALGVDEAKFATAVEDLKGVIDAGSDPAKLEAQLGKLKKSADAFGDSSALSQGFRAIGLTISITQLGTSTDFSDDSLKGTIASLASIIGVTSEVADLLANGFQGSTLKDFAGKSGKFAGALSLVSDSMSLIDAIADGDPGQIAASAGNVIGGLLTLIGGSPATVIGLAVSIVGNIVASIIDDNQFEDATNQFLENSSLDADKRECLSANPGLSETLKDFFQDNSITDAEAIAEWINSMSVDQLMIFANETTITPNLDDLKAFMEQAGMPGLPASEDAEKESSGSGTGGGGSSW